MFLIFVLTFSVASIFFISFFLGPSVDIIMVNWPKENLQYGAFDVDLKVTNRGISDSNLKLYIILKDEKEEEVLETINIGPLESGETFRNIVTLFPWCNETPLYKKVVFKVVSDNFIAEKSSEPIAICQA